MGLLKLKEEDNAEERDFVVRDVQIGGTSSVQMALERSVGYSGRVEAARATLDQVRVEDIDTNVVGLKVTNEKMGQLEATQIDTNTKLANVEMTVAHIDKSLVALLRRFDEMHANTNGGRDEGAEGNWDDYVADTEQDDQEAPNRRRLRTNRRGMGGFRRREVTSLSHVEAKKRYEFLEAVSATMDSHLRYFKQGYELLHQMEPYINQKSGNGQHDVRGTHHHRTSMKPEKPIDLLRKVDGNNMCADCGASEPDWASLNLGALLCIECSGVHRNLGVHISMVRSLTHDVRVWEPSVINLFQSLGNMFVNSIWEETLPDDNSSADGSDTSQYLSISKPKHKDVFSAKEKFIHAKQCMGC
ncbi:ADP-ribosylation factor GTPase-activating protein AGD3 [Zea mays]|uniref:ADP-ribosylation factor GTPase-activating protein AGD3 n=1 Tax=Zea mays TaxID=4577 RepID=A0A3L6FWD4_MAIZE|nr:ADP-ribosylation factor GTPase-activating protein AGD3 [Zea mays]